MVSDRGVAIKKKLVTVIIVVVILIVAASLLVLIKKRNTAEDTASAQQEQLVLGTDNSKEFDNVLIAENEDYQLYLYGPTLSISVKNKTTGVVLESSVAKDDGKNNAQWLGFMKSGIVLNVLEGMNDQGQADLVNNASNIVIGKTNNGFTADVAFTDYGFGFRVKVSLEEAGLVVEIPDKSIVETQDNYNIAAINVFPFLGSSYLGEKSGYMFIPDGNGALINLDDKHGRLTGGYSQLIYGDDIGFQDSSTESLLWDSYQTVNEAEYILAPVFGLVHTDDSFGFLGIIESGEERASIEAYPNGVKIDYNRIYPKFLLRKIYVEPTSKSNTDTIQQKEKDRSHDDIRVRYAFVTGDKANYTGLALTYRDYLQDSDSLTTKDTGYHTRLDFLGTEREEGILNNKRVVMTTVDNIKKIYKELKTEGITELFSVFKGWQDGGLQQIPITGYKADKGIGGTKELTGLLKEINQGDSEMYLYQDALRINPDEFNTTFHIVKRVNKRTYEEDSYKQVYNTFRYLTPERSDFYLKKTGDDYLDKGVTTVALSGITNSIYSYSYSGKYYSRSDTMKAYEAAVSGLNGDFKLAMEQPFSYMWKYTSAFLDMPIGSSSYNFVDEEVPFLTIALKGILPMYSEYVNFEADKQEYLLRLIETGVYPSFYITEADSSDLIYTNSADIYSSKYSIYKDDILKFTDILREVDKAVEGSTIAQHQKLENGVTVVTYENGVKIYVNYSKEDQIVDGYTIDAMSYKVGEP